MEKYEKERTETNKIQAENILAQNYEEKNTATNDGKNNENNFTLQNECKNCNFIANNSYDLRIHQDNIHNKYCNSCDYSTNNVNEINDHVQKNHNMSYAQVTNTNSNTKILIIPDIIEDDLDSTSKYEEL